ncbi:hypothetical protein [Bacillus subtilis]|uniref:hypothetical protein n=1 Tax=Bacillus subtilis TaxID=1423 RepID=UPI002027530B|nr:hypothetical protein [Bacillus subtilis]MCL9628354.1 hypothetical protein [Bacillus subtilis]
MDEATDEIIWVPDGLVRYVDRGIETERLLFREGIKRGIMKPKSVYNNIYNLVVEFSDLVRMMNWRIAYGYIKVSDSKYLRSCFLTQGDKVIDPGSLFFHPVDNEDYYTFTELHLVEYIDLLTGGLDSGLPALKETLKTREEKFKEYANERGWDCYG